MMSDRLRLVVMGDSFVGKSSIIRRFLFGTFNNKYLATVEDLFSRDYEIGGTSLKVDILDTAGDAQFPAMRRLSIASAHAFLLVYSVTDPTSFAGVKQRFEEIKEQRSDFQEIPIVIAGNKIDLVREVERSEVEDWVHQEMPKLRTEVIDCSASDDSDIKKIFRSFLVLSKINFAPRCGFSDDGQLGLKRNLSAYGRLKSPIHAQKNFPLANGNNGSLQQIDQMTPTPAGAGDGKRKGSSGSGSLSSSPAATTKGERKFFGLSLGPFGSPGGQKFLQPDTNHTNGQENNGFSKGRNTKRSRSLIRRSSKKAKAQVNNMCNPDDCVVS